MTSPAAPHTPKTRALIAYSSESLSDRAQRQLGNHLRECDVCRHELARVRAYDAAVDDARLTAPSVDWSKIELALRREAKAQARRQKKFRVHPAVAVGALAAAAAFALFALRSRSIKPETTTIPGAAIASSAAIEPRFSATVTAIAGTVHHGDLAAGANADVSREAVSIGDEVTEGNRIDAGSGSEVHLRIAERTGIALSPETHVDLQSVRPDDCKLGLQQGEVASAVKTGTPFEVRAGEYVVRARGTVFAVRKKRAAVAVRLEEGSVEIRKQGQVVTVLRAPATWTSSSDMVAPDAVLMPRGLLESQLAWPVLKLPKFGYITRWEVDQTAFSADGQVAMQAAPNPKLVVLGFGPKSEEYRAEIDLRTEGAVLEEQLLTRINEQVAGYLDPADIQKVVRSHYRALRQCYERALKTAPEVHGVFTLRVSVGLSGSVRRVRLQTKEDAPEAMTGCIVRQAEQWIFPRPEGGPVTFSLPLNLTSGG